MEFLTHDGLLAGGDPPTRIRAHCERSRTRFVTEMGKPENFGMAKSLVTGAGGIVPGGIVPGGPGSAEDVDAMLARITEHYPEVDDDDLDGPPRIGPVRPPDDDAVRASAASAPLLDTIRSLADYCAAPGRTLTAKGNLRLADARRLVEALSTGDDPTLGGARKLTSAEELPELSWFVHVAVESGAVRRHKGKLVGVARFAALDVVAAHDKVFRAVLGSGLGTRRVPLLAWVRQAQELLDGCVVLHLIALLHGDAESDELIETARGVVLPALGGLSVLLDDLLPVTVPCR